ncbi:MAG: Ldh family oxidoreductase [Motiliproteus sp.]
MKKGQQATNGGGANGAESAATADLWLTLEEIQDLSQRAAEACGACCDNALSLAMSIAAAEAEGLTNVGLAHLADYCEGLRVGRIDGNVRPTVTKPTPMVFQVDVHSGLAHPGFDIVYEDLVAAAKQFGVAIFSLRNSYTCGALGYFVSRLASAGLVAQATTNAGPPAVAAAGGDKPVFGTNPLAFAVPGSDGPALIIDQSCSATALVNIRAAGERGERLPDGWAVDAQGQPTTDPKAALTGALLAFGGYKGSNIALLVEMLSAGLTGANWSCDAPSFVAGNRCPDVGLFIIAINPAVVFGDGFEARISAYMDRFTHDYGGRVPGAKRAEAIRQSEQGVRVPAELIARLNGYISRSISDGYGIGRRQ